MILKWRTNTFLNGKNQKALLCASSLLALLPIAPFSVVILVGTFPSPFQIVPFLVQSQLLAASYLKRSFFFPHSNKVSVSPQLAGPQEVPVKQLYEDLHLCPIIPANMMKWNNVCLFIFFPTKLITGLPEKDENPISFLSHTSSHSQNGNSCILTSVTLLCLPCQPKCIPSSWWWYWWYVLMLMLNNRVESDGSCQENASSQQQWRL